jgi:daunorubicin resistance ABC transporter ATP-binding subunit
MTDAIEVIDLHKTYKGDVKALDGVSFSVEQGTVFGLLGPNGSGKTTAVRILTTILKLDKGKALVLGHDVSKEPQTIRRIVGLAGQYAAVDENLTATENILMVGHLSHLPHKLVKDRAGELLELFHLTDAATRPLKTYSGGMRRRLDLAVALVSRPPVLFLDEPTTGLDPQSRLDLWGVIENLVGAGTTVLLTTQYLEEADRLAGQLAVLDHGSVISRGTPAELKATMGATVVQIGLNTDAVARQAASALAGIGPTPARVDGSTVEATVSDGPRSAMEALRLLDQQGIEPITFALREPSLDDVFLNLTGRRTEGDSDAETVADQKEAAR